MNRKLLSLGLVVSVILLATGQVFAWGVASGDGSRYDMIQEKAVFFNNSGSDLTSGAVVVLDRTGTGVTSGSTLGSYITTTTSADNIEVVGVVGDGQLCLDQTPCVIVTKGPARVRVLDGTDAVTTGSAVGSATTAEFAGGGTNLGIALEAGDGADGEVIFIWVDPTGAD